MECNTYYTMSAKVTVIIHTFSYSIWLEDPSRFNLKQVWNNMLTTWRFEYSIHLDVVARCWYLGIITPQISSQQHSTLSSRFRKPLPPWLRFLCALLRRIGPGMSFYFWTSVNVDTLTVCTVIWGNGDDYSPGIGANPIFSVCSIWIKWDVIMIIIKNSSQFWVDPCIALFKVECLTRLVVKPCG